MQKYYIKTFGCQMNVHDSEKIAGMLKSLEYEETNKKEQADIIVFNTCCIRDGVEQKIFGNIGDLKRLKKQNPNLIIAICGCLSQQNGRAEVIKQKFPFVSIVLGTHNLNELKNYIVKFKQTHKRIFDVWEKEKAIDENVEMFRTSNYNAWVNIMYGCNNFCTYCIVPYVRGRERSRKMEDVYSEVESLVNNGYKYITLLGQNVNSYGNDINDGKTTFANLLKLLTTIKGDFRIKFMTSHPKDLNDDVINVIATEPKICNTIHLPVQSGSTKILKLMNRNYSREQYLNLIKKIKQAIPDVYLSTDIIVGFPNETEEDFLDTYTLIKEVNYGGVFAFMYSKRTGTVAEKMENQIDEKIKNERVNKILKLSKSLIKQQNKEMCGKTFEGIIEKELENNKYLAVLHSGKNVIVESENSLPILSFQNIKITNNEASQLFGVINN